MNNRTWLFLLVITALTGCGGGSGGSDSTVTEKPVVPETANYLVSTEAGAGGTISPASAQVKAGQNATFSLTPQTGFVVDSATGCNGTLDGLSYSTAAVNAACTIKVSFKKQTLLLTAAAGTGGSISPGEQNIAYGEPAEWTLSASPGYLIDRVTGCNGSLNGNLYKVATVTTACQVRALFKLQTFVVSASWGTGGRLTPESQPAASEAIAWLNVLPDNGYMLSQISGCGGIMTGDMYQTAPVTANCQVEATFAPIGYQVIASSSAGGVISPASQHVLHGAQLQFTLTADSGFDITTASGCDGVLNGNIYTTGPVTAPCAVTASFNPTAEVVFPDPQLDAAIRELLKIDAGAVIPKSSVAALTYLDVDYQNIVNLQGLQHAVNLMNLQARNNKIARLEPLQNLSKLRDLSLSYNPIVDLSPLKNLADLRRLYIYQVKTEDLSPLQGLALTGLGLDNPAVLDLSPLRGMPLEAFSLLSSATSDISPLADSALQYLNLFGSKVRDISVLRNLGKLRTANLNLTEVTDLTALLQADTLFSLDLSRTLLTDFSVLKNLKFGQNAWLSVSGCVDQTGYSLHLDELNALKAKHNLTLSLYGEKRDDCPDTLAGVTLNAQGQVQNRQLSYSWQASGNNTTLHCALYLDVDDQLPGQPVSPMQACANDGQQLFSGYQADQFRPAILFDNGIGGEKLLRLPEVGKAPAAPALQSVDLSQVTLSKKPLLTQQRDGLLRLHLTAAQAPAVLPKLQVQLSLNGNSTLLDATAPTQPLPVSKVHASLNHSYKLTVPASWMKTGLVLKVLQDGTQVRALTPEFAGERPLAIRIVPFQLGDSVATLPAVDFVQRTVQKFWPFAAVEVRTRAPYQLQVSGTKTTAYVMLDELVDLRSIENERVYYYGYFKPEMGDGCCGGLGYIGFPAAVGFDTDNNGSILAHELGHNFGRPHVACGNPSGTDAMYPYNPKSIGSYGLAPDFGSTFSPATYSDVMSYCQPVHVSDYNVAAVQAFVLKTPPAAFPAALPAQTQSQGLTEAKVHGAAALYLSGSFSQGKMNIRSLVPLSRAPNEIAQSDVVLRLLDAQGRWHQFNVLLQQYDHAEGQVEQRFQLEMPALSIKKLQIWRANEQLAELSQDAQLLAKSQQQQQNLGSSIRLQEKSNEVCVSWPADGIAGITLLHRQNGRDFVLALNEKSADFCRDSSTLPPGGEWRLSWRQQLLLREFTQQR